MTIVKRCVQVILLAAGTVALSGCYAVVTDHPYGGRPHFKSHHHYDYRPHHHRHYYDHHRRDRDRGHRRGRHRHH